MITIKFGFYVNEKDYTDYVTLTAETQEDCINDFREWLESRGLGEDNSRAWVEDIISETK